jgi:hypothetical protein
MNFLMSKNDNKFINLIYCFHLDLISIPLKQNYKSVSFYSSQVDLEIEYCLSDRGFYLGLLLVS